MGEVARSHNGGVIADYDPDADVLYLSLGRPVPSESEDDESGVALRWSLSTGAPSGATVVGYSEYHWPTQLDRLTKIISKHLHVSARDAFSAIEIATSSKELK